MKDLNQLALPLQIRFLRLPVEWEIDSGRRACARLAQLMKQVERRRDPDYRDVLRELERLRKRWQQPTTRLAYPRHMLGKAAGSLDGWALREEFLKLPHTEAALLALLNKIGVWENLGRGDLAAVPNDIPNQWNDFFRAKWRHGQESIPGFPEEVVAFWQEQSWWKGWLLAPRAQRELPLLVGIHWKMGMARAVCEIANFEILLSVTAQLDLIRGVRFQVCQRPDCAAPFPVRSKHQRKFCSQKCGHCESQRKNRLEAKGK